MAKLFVIAGHGAGDSGAVGNGYTEAERVRALANRIKAFGGANVTVGDTSRNWYKDNGISSLNISKDYKIIELHMDSASAASAKGGHVIINGAFSADNYDKALASFITGMFPGRANSIVGRSDLANPKRAAAKGYNYRLLECCFISNASDVNKFNSQMDALAKGILAAFGIGASSTPSTSTPTTSTGGGSGSGLAVDGSFGPATIRACQRALGTTVDGYVSGQARSDMNAVNKGGLPSGYWKIGSGGSLMVKALQRKVGAKVDGYFGVNTCKALQKYLGTTVDGYVSKGSLMVKELQRRLNAGTF